MPRKRHITRLSVNLRYMRLQAEFTQQFIASLIGCTRYAICKYESGDRTPSTMQLRRLAHAFKTTMDALVNEDPSGVFTEEGKSNE